MEGFGVTPSLKVPGKKKKDWIGTSFKLFCSVCPGRGMSLPAEEVTSNVPGV